MALNEDLNAFLNDFGVSCTAGAVNALGILDMPTQVLAGDQILYGTGRTEPGQQFDQVFGILGGYFRTS